jgi:hypothetical protein
VQSTFNTEVSYTKGVDMILSYAQEVVKNPRLPSSLSKTLCSYPFMKAAIDPAIKISTTTTTTTMTTTTPQGIDNSTSVIKEESDYGKQFEDSKK